MKSIPVLFKLVLAHNRKRWTRMTLGILGIAVSICLVVWIIRGYEAAALDSARSAQQESRYDVVVSPPSQMMMPGQRGGGGGGQRPPPPSMDAAAKYVDEKWVEGLRQDGAAAEVVPLMSTRVRLVDPPPPPQMGPFGGAMLIGTDSDQPLQALGAGAWLTAAAGDAAVISGGFSERNKLKPGDSFVVGGIGGEVRLTVAGVLQAAGLLFFAFAGYARIATLGEEVRDPARTIPRAIPIALAPPAVFSMRSGTSRSSPSIALRQLSKPTAGSSLADTCPPCTMTPRAPTSAASFTWRARIWRLGMRMRLCVVATLIT